jgi:hypothetical protein
MTDNPADTAPPDYSTLSPELAAEKLVELSRAYADSQPAKQIHELDSATAAQRLAELTKAYHEGSKPRHSGADAEIVGEARPNEFIETTSWPATTVRNKLDVIETLRSYEIPERGIAQIVSGTGSPYTKDDVAWARHQRDVVFKDPEIAALILSGDRTAMRHVIGVNQILIVGADQEEQK